ncbi:HAD family hydrolase [Thaumasiovibrio subtropicus]|uniref:HAD-IIB family hydrolase n=1 Tax=Thaumasiovibrio subtropicus TaxID=1891207 RepID=UPI000B35B8AA|nr:HAD family hydrolase [Thaumasiovibrio subtropicus]
MRNLVFDLDGTLVFKGQPLSASIATALRHAKKEGLNVVFATARPLRDTLPLLPTDLQNGFIIGCNGAMISRYGKVQSANRFETRQIRALIQWLQDAEIPYLIDSQDDYAISSVPHPFHEFVNALGSAPKPLECILQVGITKLLILDKSLRAKIEAEAEQMLDSFQIYEHVSDDSFDMVPEACNKLTALEAAGIQMAETACFGNDHNDIAMLEAAASAVVVGDQLHFSAPCLRVSENDMQTRLDDLISTLVTAPSF